MNITIVGCGNIGTQFAVHCINKGHSVIMFGSKPNKINKELYIVNENNNITIKGKITLATSEPKEAFENTDLIFVTMPAYCMEDISNKILPFVKKGMKIGIIPGTGGGEYSFKKCAEKGAILFGLQRVPSVARLIEYGKIVCASGYRDELFLAAIPSVYTGECCDFISNIFDMKCTALPNYLNVTLTPSNPILHTTRLRTIFKDYQEGVHYDNVPLIYEDWNLESSELLLKCDEEVQNICKAIKELDLSKVKSLKVHYESENAIELTNKIKSIKSFKGLKTPCVETEKGLKPDFNSRYFTADFPYGLAILVQIGKLASTNIKNMQETLDWYENVTNNFAEFRLENYSIHSVKDLIEYYK